MKSLENVEELEFNLWMTKIDSESLKLIAESLKKNYKLKKLVINLLGCRNIKAEEFELFGKAL